VQVFYVAEGAVEVRVHRTSFVMSYGGQFMVPRGESGLLPRHIGRSNTCCYLNAPSPSLATIWIRDVLIGLGNQYSIKNISERTTAQLFFAQARKLRITEKEHADAEQLMAGLGKGGNRSIGAAAPADLGASTIRNGAADEGVEEGDGDEDVDEDADLEKNAVEDEEGEEEEEEMPTKGKRRAIGRAVKAVGAKAGKGKK
jgi:hypothetical protein